METEQTATKQTMQISFDPGMDTGMVVWVGRKPFRHLLKHRKRDQFSARIHYLCEQIDEALTPYRDLYVLDEIAIERNSAHNPKTMGPSMHKLWGEIHLIAGIFLGRGVPVRFIGTGSPKVPAAILGKAFNFGVCSDHELDALLVGVMAGYHER